MKRISLFMLIPLLLLVLMFLVWPDFPYAHPSLIARVTFVLPLLLLSPWLVLDNRIAIGLTGFLSIAYLAHGATEIIANPSVRVAASVEIFLSFLILIGVSINLRLRRHVKAFEAPLE